MVTVSYDGTWDGLLTAVFEIYEYKLHPSMFVRGESPQHPPLFGHVHEVVTEHKKSKRVLLGLEKRVGKEGVRELYLAYLSELPDIEILILQVVRYYLRATGQAASNYARGDVLRLKQINKAVSRERHRFKAFVRFKLLKDGLYFAIIEPDFNILPLVARHFRDRYADQMWLIYDQKRKYGIYYDGRQCMQEVTLSATDTGSDSTHILAEDEALYDTLWKQYFKSTNISERKNTKLHVQHVPKRYWKYLNEKQPG